MGSELDNEERRTPTREPTRKLTQLEFARQAFETVWQAELKTATAGDSNHAPDTDLDTAPQAHHRHWMLKGWNSAIFLLRDASTFDQAAIDQCFAAAWKLELALNGGVSSSAPYRDWMRKGWDSATKTVLFSNEFPSPICTSDAEPAEASVPPAAHGANN
jgi:hypothetical protein